MSHRKRPTASQKRCPNLTASSPPAVPATTVVVATHTRKLSHVIDVANQRPMSRPMTAPQAKWTTIPTFERSVVFVIVAVSCRLTLALSRAGNRHPHNSVGVVRTPVVLGEDEHNYGSLSRDDACDVDIESIIVSRRAPLEAGPLVFDEDDPFLAR